MRPATVCGASNQWNGEGARKLPAFRVESLLELSGQIGRFNAGER
ncbi:hypothetical protein ACFC09_00090 [Streptomyces sp. NPDC056161]